MEIVQVLMSTYNGEKYLREQIDSILAQKDVIVKIFIRDDGSTDNTKLILNEYKRNGKIEWYDGDNLKPALSFLDLMKNAGDFDYYAFCDQDDIWDENKLSIAIDKLNINKSDKPAMYFSNAKLINENGESLHKYHLSKKINITAESGFIQNIALGCTIVFNREALNKAILADYSTDIAMHDAWIYRICLAFGEVIYDDKAYIRYRQHNNNVVGGRKNIIKRIKVRIINLKKSRSLKKSKRMEEFLNIYGETLPHEIRELAFKIAFCNKSIKSRLGIFLDNKICMQSKFDTILFKISALLGIV